MNRRHFLAGTAAIALSKGIAARIPGRAAKVPPPLTPRHPRRIEQLGRLRVDPYAWLKPKNWKAVWRDAGALDPAIRDYLKLENRYCASVLAPTEALQATMVAEMKARTAPSPALPPVHDGEWAYFTRFIDGAQHPQYLRRPIEGGPATLVLDADARARGHAYYALVNPAHSPDQDFFAWAEDTSGAEKYTIQVMDITTGAMMPDPPTSAFGDFVFSPDSNWLFWVWRDPNSRPARLYRRPVNGGADELVYEETDPAFLMEVLLSASRDYIFIRSWNDVTSEVRFVSATDPTGDPVLAAPRRTGTIYDLAHRGDEFVIRTNADGADDFKLMRTPVTAPHPGNWREWVPCRPGHFITETHAFADHFVWIERVEGNAHVMAMSDVGAPTEPVRFDEAAYSVSVEPSDYAANVLRLIYESPRRPKTWLACDLANGNRTVLARQEVPPNFDPCTYVVERRHARAADGAAVPITILRARKTALDGSAPVLLTGYGAYGYSVETGFSVPLLSMIDRGWIWAVAHVRGGSEKGRGWFEQARRFTKKTSFTDFVACAQTLIDERYTAAKRIVPHGYSAGGLLVGAAENMRPDLWGALIGQAPFVDMLNTMSDATHPLVPLTRPVWGDPLHDPKAYDYIASYSPYDNVAALPYPPTLATTAVSDDRVGFWEPAKWIARLRARSTSDRPMLLHTEMAGGHHGAAGRYDEFTQAARIYAFAIAALDGTLA